jgi:hemerythrin-like metal-binding protein
MTTNNALFGRMQMQHFAVNNLIQWGDHLSVEDAAIDAQHKAIFDLGTSVYESWRGGGSIVTLRPAVDKLAHLLPAHFAYEERMLAEINYEDLDQHVAEHRGMLNELSVMRANVFTTSRKATNPLRARRWPRAGRSCNSSLGLPSVTS